MTGGDNLDFWAHDSTYRNDHAGNLGDAIDVFDGVRFTSFTPVTNPTSRFVAVDNIDRDGLAIPVGLRLQIDAGTTVRVAGDAHNSGFDSTRTEFLVAGTLRSGGTGIRLQGTAPVKILQAQVSNSGRPGLVREGGFLDCRESSFTDNGTVRDDAVNVVLSTDIFGFFGNNTLPGGIGVLTSGSRQVRTRLDVGGILFYTPLLRVR